MLGHKSRPYSVTKFKRSYSIFIRSAQIYNDRYFVNLVPISRSFIRKSSNNLLYSREYSPCSAIGQQSILMNSFLIWCYILFEVYQRLCDEARRIVTHYDSRSIELRHDVILKETQNKSGSDVHCSSYQQPVSYMHHINQKILGSLWNEMTLVPSCQWIGGQ